MKLKQEFYCLRIWNSTGCLPLAQQIELSHSESTLNLLDNGTQGDTTTSSKESFVPWHPKKFCGKRLPNSKGGISSTYESDSTLHSPMDEATLAECIDVYNSYPYILRLCLADLNGGSSFGGSKAQNDFMVGQNGAYYSAFVIRMDQYLLSHLMRVLEHSESYRHAFYRNFAQKLPHYKTHKTGPCRLLSLLICIKAPTRHFLDSVGSRMAASLLHEKHDLDCALSWLSTLGGAFSSLGEISKSWAVSAGEISMKQLKLAIRLSDPLITSRCKIYIALSLIQRGYLRYARRILEAEYRFFLSLPDGMDNRLGKICKGVWHKLKHEWILQREIKKHRNQHHHP